MYTFFHYSDKPPSRRQILRISLSICSSASVEYLIFYNIFIFPSINSASACFSSRSRIFPHQSINSSIFSFTSVCSLSIPDCNPYLWQKLQPGSDCAYMQTATTLPQYISFSSRSFYFHPYISVFY